MYPRLLVVAPSAYTLSGLATWLDYLLPALRAEGWDVTLGLVEGARHHEPVAYIEQHPDSQWIPIRCLSGTSRGRRDVVARTIRRVRPDLLVSVNIPDSLVALAELRARGDSQTRGVIACHGVQPDLFADMALLRNSTDAVICVNRLACRLAKELGGFSAERVLYAACGTPLPESTRQSRQCSAPLRIAFVGRLEQQQKRILDLPAIGRGLQDAGVDFEFMIAGTGPDEASLREHLAAHGLLPRVRFLGHVPPKAMATTVYSQADLLLMTSFWETGPIVIWEAMANGLIVVSSRYIGSGCEAALVDGHNSLLFEIGDTVAATGQIRRLSEDSRLTDSLAKAARRTVARRYAQAISVSAWREAFKYVIAMEPRTIETVSLEGCSEGRLTRWLGEHQAEWIRRCLRRRGVDTGPAGEWPHTLTGTRCNDDNFWSVARRIDSSTIPERDDVSC